MYPARWACSGLRPNRWDDSMWKACYLENTSVRNGSDNLNSMNSDQALDTQPGVTLTKQLSQRPQSPHYHESLANRQTSAVVMSNCCSAVWGSIWFGKAVSVFSCFCRAIGEAWVSSFFSLHQISQLAWCRSLILMPFTLRVGSNKQFL